MDDPMSRPVARCPVQPHTHVHDLPGELMVKHQYGSLATVNHPAGGVKAMRRPPLPKWRPRPPPLLVPDLHRKMRVHCPRVADSASPPTHTHTTQCHGVQLNAVHGNRGMLGVARLGSAWLSMLSCALVPCAACGMRGALCSDVALITPLFWAPPICPNCRGGPVSHMGVPTGPRFWLVAFVRRYPCRPISVWAFPRWPRLRLGNPMGQNPHAPTFPAHWFHPYPHIRVKFCLTATYTFV